MTSIDSSATLFHCWRHDPVESARRIFASIVRKGFLLTTTNAGALDKFIVRDGKMSSARSK